MPLNLCGFLKGILVLRRIDYHLSLSPIALGAAYAAAH
jgi:hypothetical protein